ncbi:MAG TPA: metalloregulator ArsR/SmtB family transcription factor [Acidimicrobiales bacterium]|nr:metalloregulator ArsR/SmtB family transcription factor [Acidimicrobiales bacterium]
MTVRPAGAPAISSAGGTGASLCCGSLLEAPLGEAEAADLARVLGALADPVRLRLLSIVASQGEVCSCDLELPLGKSQPTISHHTKVLAEAGLIVGERRGRWTWWSIQPEHLATVRRALGG